MEKDRYAERPGGPLGPPGTSKWLVFLLAVSLLMIFAFVLIPGLPGLLGLKHSHNLIIEEGIEAGAFYYPDVKKVGEAESYLRDSRDYGPPGFDSSQ